MSVDTSVFRSLEFAPLTVTYSSAALYHVIRTWIQFYFTPFLWRMMNEINIDENMIIYALLIWAVIDVTDWNSWLKKKCSVRTRGPLTWERTVGHLIDLRISISVKVASLFQRSRGIRDAVSRRLSASAWSWYFQILFTQIDNAQVSERAIWRSSSVRRDIRWRSRSIKNSR